MIFKNIPKKRTTLSKILVHFIDYIHTSGFGLCLPHNNFKVRI